jgi:hypothetical protein
MGRLANRLWDGRSVVDRLGGAEAHRFIANSIKAMEAMVAFMTRYGGEPHAQR